MAYIYQQKLCTLPSLRNVPKRRGTRRGGCPRLSNLQSVATERSVFQLQPSRDQPTMTEIRDAYEACALHADPNGRQQCYALFGLDGERIDRYYHAVVDMEQAYETELEQDGQMERTGHFSLDLSAVASAWSFFKLFASMFIAFAGFVLALSAGMLAGLFALKPRRERELVHK